MNQRDRGQQGMTLVELIVVMAILAVLVAGVSLSVIGFTSQGKERAYDADRQMLQTAVDAWRTDVGRRTNNPYPLLLGGASCLGTVNPSDGALTQPGCNPYLDVGALATEKYISDSGAVRSADKTRNTSATNAASGHYSWYLDSVGRVTSYPTVQKGLYP